MSNVFNVNRHNTDKAGAQRRFFSSSLMFSASVIHAKQKPVFWWAEDRKAVMIVFLMLKERNLGVCYTKKWFVSSEKQSLTNSLIVRKEFVLAARVFAFSKLHWGGGTWCCAGQQSSAKWANAFQQINIFVLSPHCLHADGGGSGLVRVGRRKPILLQLRALQLLSAFRISFFVFKEVVWCKIGSMTIQTSNLRLPSTTEGVLASLLMKHIAICLCSCRC